MTAAGGFSVSGLKMESGPEVVNVIVEFFNKFCSFVMIGFSC